MRKRKIAALLLIGWTVPFFAFAQANMKKVTLRLQNVPVKMLFDALHKQTGLNFVYNNEQAKELSSVSIRAKDATVKEVLDKVLTQTAFGYTVENNTVTLFKGKSATRGGGKNRQGKSR